MELTPVVCINNDGYEFLKENEVINVLENWKEYDCLAFFYYLNGTEKFTTTVPVTKFMSLNEYKKVIVKKRFQLGLIEKHL
jgi:hypothetical protein